jgi:hypothetical protein
VMSSRHIVLRLLRGPASLPELVREREWMPSRALDPTRKRWAAARAPARQQRHNRLFCLVLFKRLSMRSPPVLLTAC